MIVFSDILLLFGCNLLLFLFLLFFPFKLSLIHFAIAIWVDRAVDPIEEVVYQEKLVCTFHSHRRLLLSQCVIAIGQTLVQG